MAWLSQSSTAAYRLVSDDSFWQPVSLSKAPAVLVNGQAVSWQWVNLQFRVRERVEEWRGLSKAAAFAIGGDEQQMSGDGTINFPNYEVKISRRLSNAAGGYIVTKTTRWTAIYRNSGVNGAMVRIDGAAESVFTATTPPSPSAS